MSAVERARQALADWDYDQEQGCMSVRDIVFADLVRDLLRVIELLQEALDTQYELLQEALDTQYEAGRLAARKIDTQAATLARVESLADTWDSGDLEIHEPGTDPGSDPWRASQQLRAALAGDDHA